MTPADDIWRTHARSLADDMAPASTAWRRAITQTPRHTFTPRVWELRDGRPHLTEANTIPETVYSDRTLTTQLGTLHADHATGSEEPDWLPTSSSPAPSLALRMIEHTCMLEGLRLLIVGTGSGYSTALACHRYGDDCVTTIDVDPYLTDAASQRLASLNYRPEIITADATAVPLAHYDRIVSMVSVPGIPRTWLDALNPGGRLVAPISGTCLLIKVHKHPDGQLTARTARDYAEFMPTRHGSNGPTPLPERIPWALDLAGEHVTTGSYPALRNNWEFETIVRLALGVEIYYMLRGDVHTTLLADLPRRGEWSWARVEYRDGWAPVVHQAGCRRLWDELDRLAPDYLMNGALSIFDAPVEVQPDGTASLQWGSHTLTLPPAPQPAHAAS